MRGMKRCWSASACWQAAVIKAVSGWVGAHGDRFGCMLSLALGQASTKGTSEKKTKKDIILSMCVLLCAGESSLGNGTEFVHIFCKIRC